MSISQSVLYSLAFRSILNLCTSICLSLDLKCRQHTSAWLGDTDFPSDFKKHREK